LPLSNMRQAPILIEELKTFTQLQTYILF